MRGSDTQTPQALQAKSFAESTRASVLERGICDENRHCGARRCKRSHRTSNRKRNEGSHEREERRREIRANAGRQIDQRGRDRDRQAHIPEGVPDER